MVAYDEEGYPYVQGEVLVRFERGTRASSRTSAHSSLGVKSARSVQGLAGLELARAPEGVSAEALAEAYAKQPGVAYAQPNYLHSIETTPNDPRFDELWGMSSPWDADIDATDAWDIETGSDSVVVAVIDTGFDYNHPDLADNAWSNPGEIPGNGLDDDWNGYVDDVHGTDTVNEDGDPMDDNDHGTHCSGTIGAVGDNAIGVVGVNWDVSIMGVKCFTSDGWGTTEDIVEAIWYADMMGADVMSNSWGGGPFEQVLYDAIAYTDALFVAAAGNWGEDTDQWTNYPSGYDLPNIVAVGASNMYDERAEFSNYGAESVDLFAPGEMILSTVAGPLPTFRPSVVATLWADDMSALTDWDTSEYSVKAWTLDTDDYASPPASAVHANYRNKESSWIKLTDPVDLSGVGSAALTFNTTYFLEWDYDYLSAYVSTDSANWEKVGSLTGEQWDWASTAFDISQMAGESTVTVAFELSSDSSIDSREGFWGAAVDDVAIVETEQLFFDPFADLSGWDTSEYEVNPWSLSTTVSVSPPYSAAQESYASDEDAWMVLDAPLDLSSATANLALQFDAWVVTEPGFDVMTVLASTDTTGWTSLGAYSGWDSMGFEEMSLDMSAFAGEPQVYLAFRFTSDGSFDGGDGLPGVFVDNVRVAEGSWTSPDYTDAYEYFDGTSMATPHVAGAAALILAAKPFYTSDDLKASILASVDATANFEGLCVTGGRLNAYEALFDHIPPHVSDNNMGWYYIEASIEITATDESGVEGITYWFNEEDTRTVPGDYALAVSRTPGMNTLSYYAEDTLGHRSETVTTEFEIERGPVRFRTIAGTNRYDTAIRASRRAFPDGARTVVIASGMSWADALPGTALAGAVRGPMLLADGAHLGRAVTSEIKRLDATEVYIVGGGISSGVQADLKALVGRGNVTRISGRNRYETSAMVAEEVTWRGASRFDGTVFVATGRDFADALAASPIAYARCMPIVFADPAGRLDIPWGTTNAVILGGEGAVSAGIEAGLIARLGAANVTRKGASNRYGTASLIAAYGINRGLHWNGVGITTGTNFPDGLAGGTMLGQQWSVMLLTPGTWMSPDTRAPLYINKRYIQDVTYIGGTSSVSASVRAEVARAVR